MKHKLKNSATDVVAFLIYHIIAVGGTLAFFMYFAEGIENLDLDSFKQLTEKMNAEAPVANKVLVKNQAIIHSVMGDVFFTNSIGTTPRKAVVGDLLAPGSVIETKAKSFATLKFGQTYNCTVRIGALSRLNVDGLLELDEDSKKESTTFNLVKGGLYLLLNNTSKQADVKIKTISAVFAVRGTHLAIRTDGFGAVLMSVLEGIVKTENIRTGKTYPISTGSSYLVEPSGLDKIENNPDILKRFDFSDAQTEVILPEDDLLSVYMQTLRPVEVSGDPTEAKPQINQEEILSEIAIFKAENDSIMSDLDSERSELKTKLSNQAQEMTKIKEDMYCLENSTKPCKLFSENILISRGFPRTFGDARIRRSLILDLRLYLKQQDEAMESKKITLKNTEDLLSKRQEVLKWAEDSVSTGTSLDTIIPRLKDRQLLR